MLNKRKRMSAAEFIKSESGNAPDPRRQLQGAVNRTSGAIFEGIINASCDYYKRCKAAYIEKTPEPMKVLSGKDKQGHFKACFNKQAQPDYKGTMARGRAVCFEAKHTDTGKIAQTSVTPEQTEALDTHFDMGAICFVVVSLGMQDFYRVPWEIWRDMKKQFGHKYMNPEELERYRLMTDRGNILFLD